MVDTLYQQGLIYADKNQNAVFIRRSLNQLTLGEMSPRQPSVVNEKSNENVGSSYYPC